MPLNSLVDNIPPCGQDHRLKINSWLSYAERNFIKFLDRAVNQRAFIFSKVKISDVFQGIDIADRRHDFALANETFDFVLCDIDDLSVLCVIELDDRPHPQQRLGREKNYATYCAAAGVPLLEIPAMCGYDVKQLKDQLQPYMPYIAKNK